MAHPTWPLFDLRLRTPRLELRPADEATMIDLMALADRGVHAPGERPFVVPWTLVEPPARRRAEGMQYYWRTWAAWSPEKWGLPLASYVDGQVVGMISVEADDFPARRVVSTGSWIGLAHHGKGYGTEQRAAVLAFAFGHLGAIRATSGAWDDNAASCRVSEKLGYRTNGDHIGVDDGQPRRGIDFVMDVDDWRREREHNERHVPVEVVGLDTALPQFGLP